MSLECVVCDKPATVIYQGTTYCRDHFNAVWAHETSMKKIGHEEEWGKSLVQLKNEKKRDEASNGRNEPS